MINYNHVYYFYEVARFNSITKAAQHLRLSQPSLSIQIKTLEQQIGFKLIEKKGRNIALTDLGQRLYSQTAAVDDPHPCGGHAVHLPDCAVCARRAD